MKRSRNINYKFNIIISSIISYNLDFDILFTIIRAKDSNFNFNLDFKISDYSDIRLKKRYKLNINTMTYYYRYLGHSKNII